jgi:hypothetical protein
MDMDGHQNQRSGGRSLEEEKSSAQSNRADPDDPNSSYISYMDKCKKIGRIGPRISCLDQRSSYGEIIFSDKENLDVEAISSFCSVRANTGVFSGRFYYEVQLKTNGLM